MIQRGEIVEPRWKDILEILVHPRAEKVVAGTDPNNPDSWDGAWDVAAMARGLGIRRISADVGRQTGNVDVAHAFVFVCQCGYHRRVITETEHSFTCERPNADNTRGCDIYWQMDTYADETDVSPKTGNPTTKARLVERKLPNGRIMLFPVIHGMSIHQARAEARKRRKDAAGGVEVAPAGMLAPPTRESHFTDSPVVAAARAETAALSEHVEPPAPPPMKPAAPPGSGSDRYFGRAQAK